MQNRILIVDDDELFLGSLESFLDDEGYIIRTLESSEKLSVTILDFDPELIILDIKIGVSDGRVICDRLKSETKTAHIPIILLTALSYDEIAHIDCHADAIIGKPYESSWLLTTIRQLILSP